MALRRFSCSRSGVPVLAKPESNLRGCIRKREKNLDASVRRSLQSAPILFEFSCRYDNELK
jgi:hypothetical protein